VPKLYYENGPAMIATIAMMKKMSKGRREKDIMKRLGAKSN